MEGSGFRARRRGFPRIGKASRGRRPERAEIPEDVSRAAARRMQRARRRGPAPCVRMPGRASSRGLCPEGNGALTKGGESSGAACFHRRPR
ncbi:hypothetical protein HMPREF1155_1377 [Slackia sp. CM382]|nr:hypothetical protein HMPREF1155_1377 [Slackia sp. CM382]